MVSKEVSMLSLSKYAATKKRTIRIDLTLRRAQDDRLCHSVEIVLTKSELLLLGYSVSGAMDIAPDLCFLSLLHSLATFGGGFGRKRPKQRAIYH